MINTFSKLGIEGDFLNLIKGIYKNLQLPTIILNGEKLKAFPLKSGKGILILTSPFVTSFPGEILDLLFASQKVCLTLRVPHPGAGTWSPLVVERGIAIPDRWADTNLCDLRKFSRLLDPSGNFWKGREVWRKHCRY